MVQMLSWSALHGMEDGCLFQNSSETVQNHSAPLVENVKNSPDEGGRSDTKPTSACAVCSLQTFGGKYPLGTDDHFIA